MSEVNNVYKNKIFYKIKLLLEKYPYAPAFLHKERCQPLSCQRHLAEAVSLWWTGMLCSVFWGSTIPCCAVRLCASFLFTGYRDILSSLFSSYTQHTCTVPAAGRLPQDCPGRPPTPSKCPVSQTRRCIRGRQTQVFPSPPLVSASMASDAPPGYPNAFFQLMSFASHPDCPEGCPPHFVPTFHVTEGTVEQSTECHQQRYVAPFFAEPGQKPWSGRRGGMPGKGFSAIRHQQIVSSV